ncbi:hypothetical protein [Nocardia amamiensis]|uniref:hypothetical protein n=1 Tax=Nocardia amamiensis TaxID=404578 RepID=UPI00082EBE80|nr:hypothetical protein [Nocardia amamiensis]
MGWAQAASHVRLTGYHLLGIERATSKLIVLAEAALPDSDRITFLPHHCHNIPDQERARWTPIPAGAN